jgi:hypothetical protein
MKERNELDRQADRLCRQMMTIPAGPPTVRERFGACPSSRRRRRAVWRADAELIALAAEIERLVAAGDEIFANRFDPLAAE